MASIDNFSIAHSMIERDDHDGSTPSLREEVARAIYDVQVKGARALVDKYDFQLDRIKRVFGVLVSETDRSLAILLFALAEDFMLNGLEFNMKENCPVGWESATSGNGVLATAQDRISILELLAWITPVVAAQLRLMKSIRNRFAHHADVNDFEDEKIIGWISTMWPADKPVFELIPKYSWTEFPRISTRQKFLIRGTTAILMMVTNIAVMPAARAFKVSPKDVEGGGVFDNFPEQLKELHGIVADVAITCLPKDLLGSD